MINERNHVLQHGHNANKNEHEVAVFVVSPRNNLFQERNSQDINKYNMRRIWEIIFLEKLNKKHQLLYHCQKRRIQLIHMKGISENIMIQFMS